MDLLVSTVGIVGKDSCSGMRSLVVKCQIIYMTSIYEWDNKKSLKISKSHNKGK